MIRLPSLNFPVPWFLKTRDRAAISISPVKVHDVDARADKRARTLKHLLKLNHASHSILYHDYGFHNHMPHILGCAYLLGSDERHLEQVYDEESKELEKWEDSPGEITVHDWRDFLGDPHYQRAYVDFFEDELVSQDYDWRKVLAQYLFQGEKPLISCVVSGLGHPLIHLGYAFELASRDIAMEALGLASTCYNYLHKYSDEPSYSKWSGCNNTSLLAILAAVAADSRFDGIFEHEGGDNFNHLFKHHEDLVLEYWNMWSIQNPLEQFKESQAVAALLLTGTQSTGSSMMRSPKYDFFLVHTLTSSHAWWLLTLAVYISQLRPEVNEDLVHNFDTKGKSWQDVIKQTLKGQWAADAHFIKAVRALREASGTWGDQDELYLKAGVKLCEQFSGWSGFGQ